MFKLIVLAAIVIALGAVLVVIGIVIFAVGLTPEESARERIQEEIDNGYSVIDNSDLKDV